MLVITLSHSKLRTTSQTFLTMCTNCPKYFSLCVLMLKRYLIEEVKYCLKWAIPYDFEYLDIVSKYEVACFPGWLIVDLTWPPTTRQQQRTALTMHISYSHGYQACLLLYPDLGHIGPTWNSELLLLFSLFICFVVNQVSPFSPGWSRTLYVDQASCQLTEIPLSLPPQNQDWRHVPPHLEELSILWTDIAQSS